MPFNFLHLVSLRLLIFSRSSKQEIVVTGESCAFRGKICPFLGPLPLSVQWLDQAIVLVLVINAHLCIHCWRKHSSGDFWLSRFSSFRFSVSAAPRAPKKKEKKKEREGRLRQLLGYLNDIERLTQTAPRTTSWFPVPGIAAIPSILAFTLLPTFDFAP